jgi:hypothetical protein
MFDKVVFDKTVFDKTVFDDESYSIYYSKQFILKSIYYIGSKIINIFKINFILKDLKKDFIAKGFKTSYTLKNKIEDKIISQKI